MPPSERRRDRSPSDRQPGQPVVIWPRPLKTMGYSGETAPMRRWCPPATGERQCGLAFGLEPLGGVPESLPTRHQRRTTKKRTRAKATKADTIRISERGRSRRNQDGRRRPGQRRRALCVSVLERPGQSQAERGERLCIARRVSLRAMKRRTSVSAVSADFRRLTATIASRFIQERTSSDEVLKHCNDSGRLAELKAVQPSLDAFSARPEARRGEQAPARGPSSTSMS